MLCVNQSYAPVSGTDKHDIMLTMLLAVVLVGAAMVCCGVMGGFRIRRWSN